MLFYSHLFSHRCFLLSRDWTRWSQSWKHFLCRTGSQATVWMNRMMLRHNGQINRGEWSAPDCRFPACDSINGNDQLDDWINAKSFMGLIQRFHVPCDSMKKKKRNYRMCVRYTLCSISKHIQKKNWSRLICPTFGSIKADRNQKSTCQSSQWPLSDCSTFCLNFLVPHLSYPRVAVLLKWFGGWKYILLNANRYI